MISRRSLAGIGFGALACAALAIAFLRDDARAPVKPAPAAATSELHESTEAASANGRAASAGTPSDSIEVTGRLVDPSGLPFVGMDVRASGARGTQDARTDAEGRFELRGLTRGETTLDCSVGFDPSQPLGERVLAAAVPPLALDLSQGPARVDVGTQVLPRSQPCWVSGRIELDAAWARDKGVWLGDARVELAPAGLEDLGDAVRAGQWADPEAPHDWRTNPPWRASLPPAPRIEADGSFRFAVETPHDPFFVRVWVKRFEPSERLVWPEPDAERVETFRLP